MDVSIWLVPGTLLLALAAGTSKGRSTVLFIAVLIGGIVWFWVRKLSQRLGLGKSKHGHKHAHQHLEPLSPSPAGASTLSAGSARSSLSAAAPPSFAAPARPTKVMRWVGACVWREFFFSVCISSLFSRPSEWLPQICLKFAGRGRRRPKVHEMCWCVNPCHTPAHTHTHTYTAADFTLFKRRHHCRFCKKIFCHECSSEKVTGRRACVDCFALLTVQRSLLVSLPCRSSGVRYACKALAHLFVL